MSMSIKKRLVLGSAAFTTVAAAATLVAGVTFGFFSANTPATQSTFATGTVSVGTTTNTACTITNMVPGDQSAGYTGSNSGYTNTSLATCTFAVQYTGSVPAYIGLTATPSGVSTVAGSLMWQIKNGTTTFSPAGVINTNSAASPMYVATDPGNAVPASGTIYTFTVDYLLPSSVTSQTLTPGSLDLTVYAVQAGNNGSAGACTAGSQCVGITSWS